jgi:FHS family L-fucose permease-like MFS transporter
MSSPQSQQTPVIPRKFLLSFILVTSLFALWGFANDVTNPMVAAFKGILLISNFESSLVQAAFYGGYCFMAIPAAIFIKRFSYQKGIILGLCLYALGCFLFIPSGQLMAFWAFLLSYFIMTCGLSFLETSANPYILAMGDKKTATRRLNFAQSFNPMGSLAGMFVAKELILARLDSADETARINLQATDPAAFQEIQRSDLGVIIGPYITLGVVVLLVLLVFLVVRLPLTPGEEDRTLNLGPTFKRLLKRKRYIEGVVAQAFYVGAQIMCWTFIIHYGVNELGMQERTAQGYNIIAMAIFVSSRFICTFLLRFISPGRLLLLLATGGGVLILGVIFLPGMAGLYSLIGVSACMSLMFPTIYGIALDNLGDDAKLGSAGLILAIGGGSFLPPLQGAIMDTGGLLGISATRISFILPLICFVVIAVYGFRAFRVYHTAGEDDPDTKHLL